MPVQYIIPVGSAEWWFGLIFSAAYGIGIWRWSRAGESDSRRFWERIWALSILSSWLGVQFFLISGGWWRFNNDLPLQLCGISNLLSVSVLLSRNRRLFVPLFFWGIVGGTHSLLTPQVTSGSHPLLVAEYYIFHTSIILVPLYMIRAHGWRLMRYDWLKALLYNNLLLLPVSGINLWLDANYMYLVEPPKANNPFIVGEWPLYIFGFEVAALLHYLLLSTLFRSHWKSVPAFQAINSKS